MYTIYLILQLLNQILKMKKDIFNPEQKRRLMELAGLLKESDEGATGKLDSDEKKEHYRYFMNRLNNYVKDGTLSKEERDEIYADYAKEGFPTWYDIDDRRNSEGTDKPSSDDKKEHYRYFMNRLNNYVKDGTLSKEERDEIYADYAKEGFPTWYDIDDLRNK